MGNNINKRHHTVPKSYLKNFSDSNNQVWVLDTDNNIFPTNPDNILVEKHFYRITLPSGEKSVIIEDTLAEMEGTFASVYQNKISKNLPITIEERAAVAVFAAAMMHRTKPNREGLKKMFGQMKKNVEEWREQMKSLPDEQIKKMAAVPSSGGSQIRIEDMEMLLDDFDEYHSSNLPHQISHTASLLFQMKWSIWKYPPVEGGFVTSDNPVVLLRPESIKKYGKNAWGSRPGLIYKDVEVTLPLSKDRLLLAGWILEENTYISIPEEEIKMVEGMNQRTILHSTERIIASSENQLKDILSKYPSTKSLNKTQ